jgi:hypothetical protein
MDPKSDRWSDVLDLARQLGEIRAVSPPRLIVTCARGQALELRLAEAGGTPWLIALAPVTGASLTGDRALAHNATLAVGALCLVEDTLALRHACRLDAVEVDDLSLLVHEAARLRAQPATTWTGPEEVFSGYEV